MDPNKPMETIQAWQQWYQTNEKTKTENQTKAVSFFADSICSFSQDLTGEEAYQALLTAAEEHYKTAKKEYEYALDFFKAVGGLTPEN